MSSISSPVKLGSLQLRNRNWMSALTRNRSVPTNVPNDTNVVSVLVHQLPTQTQQLSVGVLHPTRQGRRRLDRHRRRADSPAGHVSCSISVDGPVLT